MCLLSRDRDIHGSEAQGKDNSTELGGIEF